MSNHPTRDYPPSWYAATRSPLPERPSLSGPGQVDVAIVGAGFAGLHLARLLIARGRRVAVLERQRVGWGASGRNGGFVSAGFAESSGVLLRQLGPAEARALYAHSQAGVRLVRSTIDELARPDIVMGHGQLTCCRTAQGPAFADQVSALAHTLGAGFEPWTNAQLHMRLKSARYHEAIHDPEAFQIHPLNLALALADDVAQRGGLVFEGTAVQAIERQEGKDGQWLCRSAGGSVRAPELVLAGNADLGPLHGRLAGAVLPVATYVAVTEPLGPQLKAFVDWPGAVTDTRRACDYFRVVDGDRLLWGGRITTDTREPRGLRDFMRRHILAVFPQLTDLRIAYAWPGIMGYALHKMPFIGRLEPGLWVSSAYGGHGVGQTAGGALLLAAAIADGDDEWKRYEAFPMRWAGGPVGRAMTQAAYWWMQARDEWDEARSPRPAAALRHM